MASAVAKRKSCESASMSVQNTSQSAGMSTPAPGTIVHRRIPLDVVVDDLMSVHCDRDQLDVSVREAAAKCGYRIEAGNTDSWTLRRGTVLRSLFAWSVRGVPITTTITLISPRRIHINLHCRSAFQVWTPANELRLERELTKLEEQLLGSMDIHDHLLRTSDPFFWASALTKPFSTTQTEATRRRTKFHLLIAGIVGFCGGCSVMLLDIAFRSRQSMSWFFAVFGVFATAVTLLALCQWWTTRFCPECGSVISIFGRLVRWCGVCGRLNKPQDVALTSRRLELVGETSELVDSETDKILATLRMLLLCAVNDQAHQITLQPGTSDYRHYGNFADRGTVELEPPPPEVHRMIVAAAKIMFCDDNGTNQDSIEGVLVSTDKRSAHVSASFSETVAGETMTLSFDHYE